MTPDVLRFPSDPVPMRCYVIATNEGLPTRDDVTVHTMTVESRLVVVPVTP